MNKTSSNACLEAHPTHCRPLYTLELTQGTVRVTHSRSFPKMYSTESFGVANLLINNTKFETSKELKSCVAMHRYPLTMIRDLKGNSSCMHILFHVMMLSFLMLQICWQNMTTSKIIKGKPFLVYGFCQVLGCFFDYIQLVSLHSNLKKNPLLFCFQTFPSYSVGKDSESNPKNKLKVKIFA